MIPLAQSTLKRSPTGTCAVSDVQPQVRANDIIAADETLRIVFALSFKKDPTKATDEEASRFLLWFAVNGRGRYQHIVFSPAYLAFLWTPMPPFATRLVAYILLSRPDLQQRFGVDTTAFQSWFYREGILEFELASLLPPRASKMPRRTDGASGSLRDNAVLPGVNIIGYGRSVMGIGEDVRALSTALNEARISRTIINLSLDPKHGTEDLPDPENNYSDRPLFPINIFALPAFETARLHVEHGRQLFYRRYSIGYWPWELTSLPDHWRGVFDLVDEVWASSEFLLDVFRKLTGKPVVLMPPYLNISAAISPPHDLYGIAEDQFVVLAMFDFNSFSARKNPEGAIAAFRRAFPSSGNERLVIKTLNAHARTDAALQLKANIADDRRIILIEDALTRPQTMALLQRADCLLSLHRAEGFGRILAEAMALGTVVVATDWSGSKSFLDQNNGYPVDYVLRDLRSGEYLFEEGSQWAEPSIADAAIKLRRVRDHRGTCEDDDKRSRAKRFVENAYGLATVSEALANRIGAIATSRRDLQCLTMVQSA